eukprot:6492730-Amphidinium_carterae.3
MLMLPARLRLRRESFALQGKAEAYNQQQLLPEFIRQSHIQFHPTSGYNKCTELKAVYDSFKIYNWHDELSPVRAREDEAPQPPNFRQLMTTSYHYASEFYNRMKGQSLQHLEQEGFNEIDIRRQERKRSTRKRALR